MSLKGFHLVFVVFSVLLSLGVAGYCAWVDYNAKEPIYQTGMIVSFVSAIALFVYGVWFYRKMKRLHLIT